MGSASAEAVAQQIRDRILSSGHANVVFAAAPSQNEFLAALAAEEGIDWAKVVAFHMDEYVGLPADAPQGFGNFLRERLFDSVKPGSVYYLNGQAEDPLAECERYAALLEENPVDIVCAGIGENGHLAFNDPPAFDTDDVPAVRVVELDLASRVQQVHDGCFSDLTEVPGHALTLSVPALVAARWVFTMVPGPTKAEAVKATLQGEIGPHCPATALRRHAAAVLYLDREAASLL